MQQLEKTANQNMTLVERVIFLQNVELFAALAPEQLARIAFIAKVIEAPAATVLVREGALSACMYIIVSGKVAVERDGELLMQASEHEVVGTWALFDDEPMLVSSTVIEDAMLICIDRSDFFDLLADHNEMVQAMFQVLVRRIRKLAE